MTIKRYNGVAPSWGATPLAQHGEPDGNELLRIDQALTRGYPDRMEYVIFPEAGGFEPLPAGETILNIEDGKVLAPDNAVRTLSADYNARDRLQSMILIADSIVNVRVEPGVGRFIADASTPVFGTGRHVERLFIAADFPYNLTVLLGTFPFPSSTQFLAKEVYRWSDTTLTKLAAAAAADGWTSMAFTPRYGNRTLNQASWGVSQIYYADTGQKMFLVRNLSLTTAAEVRVRGAINVYVAAGLNALGLTSMDYVLDPDIHQTGTPEANFVTVPALSSVLLETNLPWQMLRVEARVAGAAATGTQVRVITEIEGISFAIR